MGVGTFWKYSAVVGGAENGARSTVSEAVALPVVARQRLDSSARSKQRHGLFLSALQPVLRPNLQQRNRAHAEIRPCSARVSGSGIYCKWSFLLPISLPLSFSISLLPVPPLPLLVNSNMTGIEYLLLHVQDPVLYIIRKVRRLSPEKGVLPSMFVPSWMLHNL